MFFSEKVTELMAALVAAKKVMKMPEKDGVNPHFKSKYATLESIGKATEGALSANGLAIIQGPAYGKDGELILTTRLCHVSGQWAEIQAPLLVVKKDSQGIGAAITYMRRYSWASIIGLAGIDEEDDGNAERESLKNAISEEQFLQIKALLANDEQLTEKLTSWLSCTYGVSDLKKMPVEAFDTALGTVRAHRKAVKTHKIA